MFSLDKKHTLFSLDIQKKKKKRCSSHVFEYSQSESTSNMRCACDECFMCIST